MYMEQYAVVQPITSMVFLKNVLLCFTAENDRSQTVLVAGITTSNPANLNTSCI